jgi:hypothetical protein
MDEQKSAIPNGCPRVPENYRYAPNLVGGGQRLVLLHQNLRVAALLIKYLLTEHYR